MRVDIRVTPNDKDAWTVVLRFASQEIRREMLRARPPLPVRPRAPADDDRSLALDDERVREAVTLRVAECKPEAGDAVRMGRYLFDALIGSQAWASITESTKAGKDTLVELALTWRADEADLGNLRWEMMHDGEEFLAVSKEYVVAITRIVLDAETLAAPEPLAAPARVLFVVGDDLDSRAIRAGAEIVGVLRRIEAQRGAVLPFVLERASPQALQHQISRVRPDIVHFVSHGRVEQGHGVLQMCSDEDESTTELVGAARLLEALNDGGRQTLPRLAVVTACESAGGGDHTASLAAELVKGGIPVVVGMTGKISDPVCRLFSSRFSAALTEGEPLVRALTVGRRAALWRAAATGAGPETQVDWSLPAVFLAPSVDPAYRVVAERGNDTMARRIASFGLQERPVFCGRRRFMPLLDKLLDPDDELNVLVVDVERPKAGAAGETRLMHHLALRALRAGHVVLMLWATAHGTRPDPPTTPGRLALYLVEQLFDTRRRFGLGSPAYAAVLEALATAASSPDCPELDTLPPDAVNQHVTEYLKKLKGSQRDWEERFEADILREALARDLTLLQSDARAKPDGLSDTCRVIVMLERVEYWDQTTRALVDTLLTPDGFGVQPENPMPVVVSCALAHDVNRHTLSDLRERATTQNWIHAERLAPFDEEEDELVYTWLLLNPYDGIHPPHSEKVYVRAEPTDEWALRFREHIKGLPSNFGLPFYIVASMATEPSKLLVADENDDVKLAEYLRVGGRA
jgi:hypothetical protein